ncbi:hypothetical protein HYX01_03845 [Candidatus Woesearchaeota archaeon]|nr:hypothetical protein [Candidatus Woesearchaeota archaeon]
MDFFQQEKTINIGRINTSEREIKDLIKAWIAISIAFAVAMKGFLMLNFYGIFIVASITVGTGFLLHELGHKLVAQRYGCFAEFRSFDNMLLLAIIMSFFGFIFAAPGAVMIHGPVGTRRNGKISAAGPIINLALATFFLAVLLAANAKFIAAIAFYGFYINTWLALFNMLPFWNFDGIKILRWNKAVYFSIVMVALAFLFLRSIIS